MSFKPLVWLMLFWLSVRVATAQSEFLFVQNFERNDQLYNPTQPYTIVVRTNLTVTDAVNQRVIPILVRYPAQLVAAGQRLPVVVWSHGGGPDPDGRNGSREWSELLVRAGYVVVHFSLLDRDNAARIALWAEFGLSPTQGVQCGFNPAYVDRPRDARAVLDALPTMGTLVPELQDRLDVSKIVVAGHSFGSYTARTVAGGRVDLCPMPGVMPSTWPFHDTAMFRDARPIAFLALSPQGPGRFTWFDNGNGQHSWSQLNRPEFMATGLGDVTPGEQPPDRLLSFSLIAPQSKYLLYINALDASHATFNLNDSATPSYHQWLGSAALAFLNAHVRGDPIAAAALQSRYIQTVSNDVASVVWK